MEQTDPSRTAAELPADPDHPLIPILGSFIDRSVGSCAVLSQLAAHVRHLTDALATADEHTLPAAIIGIQNLSVLLNVATRIALKAEQVGPAHGREAIH